MKNNYFCVSFEFTWPLSLFNQLWVYIMFSFNFCQRSNGILLFLEMYPGHMEALGGLGGRSVEQKY